MEQNKQWNQKDSKEQQGKQSQFGQQSKGSERPSKSIKNSQSDELEQRESLNSDDEIDDTMMRSSAAGDELEDDADEGFQGEEKGPGNKTDRRSA